MEINRKTIESLYSYPVIMKALSPEDKQTLENLSQEESRCSVRLTKTFSPKQQFRYTDYEEILCQKNHFTHQAAFVHGFRLGVRLVLEANSR